MKELWNRLKTGIITENPIFIQMLGMCPTLAVTSTAQNGLGMGLATTAVLMLSNFFISVLRKFIPTKVRIPAFVVIIATFVTVIEMVLKAYVPSLYESLGIFVPLIVVNCIILGRAEVYASKSKVLPSVFDGIGMGLGFTLSLTVIGIVRELLSNGSIFDLTVTPKFLEPSNIFAEAPGAFFVLGVLVAIINGLRNRKTSKGRA